MTIRSIETAVMRAIPQDKCLHVIAGTLICALIHPFGWITAMSVVLLAAVVKEVTDHFTGGDVSVWDIAATLAGGGLGLLCYLR